MELQSFKGAPVPSWGFSSVLWTCNVSLSRRGQIGDSLDLLGLIFHQDATLRVCGSSSHNPPRVFLERKMLAQSNLPCPEKDTSITDQHKHSTLSWKPNTRDQTTPIAHVKGPAHKKKKKRDENDSTGDGNVIVTITTNPLLKLAWTQPTPTSCRTVRGTI